ncbi:MAG: DUF47 family protein [bacterium]|nr:DUF47 family protein [bacterium]
MQNPWHFFVPQEKEFFRMFKRQSENILTATEEFRSLILDFDKLSHTKRLARVESIRTLENSCDKLTRKTIEKLFRTFVTPIDREDIYQLAVLLDDFMDSVLDAAEKMVFFKVKKVPKYTRRQTEIIWQCVVEIDRGIGNLGQLKNVNKHCVKIHELESKADILYKSAVAELFENSKNAVDVIKFKDLNESLELVVDTAEDISNIISNIVIKHA